MLDIQDSSQRLKSCRRGFILGIFILLIFVPLLIIGGGESLGYLALYLTSFLMGGLSYLLKLSFVDRIIIFVGLIFFSIMTLLVFSSFGYFVGWLKQKNVPPSNNEKKCLRILIALWIIFVFVPILLHGCSSIVQSKEFSLLENILIDFTQNFNQIPNMTQTLIVLKYIPVSDDKIHAEMNFPIEIYLEGNGVETSTLQDKVVIMENIKNKIDTNAYRLSDNQGFPRMVKYTTKDEKILIEMYFYDSSLKVDATANK